MARVRRSLYIVAVDGSLESAKAADQAVALANKVGAEVRVVSVEDPRTPAGLALDGAGRAPAPKAAEVVEREWARAKHEGVAASKAVLSGLDAAEEIVRYAEAQGAELIVVGSRGLTGIRRILIGSVAEKVVALAHCPVLVVR